jgi:hypothetical protein
MPRRGLTQRREVVIDDEATRSIGGSASRCGSMTSEAEAYHHRPAAISRRHRRLVLVVEQEVGSSADPSGRHMAPACCDVDPAVHV